MKYEKPSLIIDTIDLDIVTGVSGYDIEVDQNPNWTPLSWDE